MQHTVRDVLKTKGDEVWSITPQATVFEALVLMAEKNVGALLVLDDGGLAGIFSERDYARKVILHGKSSKTTMVGELMTREVIGARPDDSVEHCMAVMTSNRIRHMPVFEDASLIGVVSIGDVVRKVIAGHEFTIRELENYIRGSY